MSLNRRRFIKTGLQAGIAVPLSLQIGCSSKTSNKQQVVVIGGGFAGATVAKYIRKWATDVDVIMIERNAKFVSCPQSNLVLGGNLTLQDLTRGYDDLSAHGVQRVHAAVTKIDTDQKSVSLDDGVVISYDRLVIAPGIDFIYDDLPILATEAGKQKVPHAWKAGPQTQLLRDQLVSMKQGGVIAMAIPRTPFRCPPGPYERACQVAFYLRQHNPTAKLLILDENANIASKKALFETAWQKEYKGLIEYVPNSRIESVDLPSLTVETEFDNMQVDVLNIIPPQKAGEVAAMAGVISVDNRWCEVDFLSYESTVKSHVHVIGDAIASRLPKSGHMANAQAKVCAAAVVALLDGQAPVSEPEINNICYSFIDDKQAMHVAAIYRYQPDKAEMIPVDGVNLSEVASAEEGQYAKAWAQNIWQDVLG